MDFSSTALRVPRQVAESGSFTAAASRLGCTQPAVSRQAAALERSAGAVLFERRPDGVRSQSELIRVGLFMGAGAVILPTALTQLAAASPQVTVTACEGTTPALIRALRAGSTDIAMLTSRPPYRPSEGESPRLHIDTVEATNCARILEGGHRSERGLGGDTIAVSVPRPGGSTVDMRDGTVVTPKPPAPRMSRTSGRLRPRDTSGHAHAAR